MAKLRINNQLQETSEEELRKIAEKSGAPVATSPATAATQGASPDAAKMAGSPQQKFANVQTKPKQTLQTADRRDQARQEKTQSEIAVAAKAGQLDQLSGLDERVRALVNQQFANAANTQPTGPVLNQAQIDASQVEDKDGLTSLLQQYHQLVSTSPADPQINEVLAQLANTYGITNPDEYIQTGVAATQDQAANAIVNPDEVKLANLDLNQLGFTPEQLTELLGADYANLSVGQLGQRLEDLRSQEFSEIAKLQAQLQALPPGSAQREVVLQQLADKGQVGVTGVEQGLDQLQAQVDGADQVTFGGRAYAVGDLLADDTISSIVAEFFNPAADPAWKAKLQAENPEFTQWMTQHQETLSELAKGMQESQQGFQTIQEDQKALATVGEDGQTLSDSVMKQLIPGWGTSVSSVADLSGNAIYQALQSNPDLVNKLNTDPDLVEQLQGMTAEQIQAASEAGDTLLNDPVLADILGVTGSAFITDEATLQKMSQIKPVIEGLRERGGESIGTYLADAGFQELIASGELNSGNIDQFLEDPEAFRAWEEYEADIREFKKLEKGADLDKVVNFLFGAGDLDTLNEQYSKLGKAAQDPTNKKAVAAYNQLKALDKKKPVGFGKEDMPNLLAAIEKGLGNLGFGAFLEKGTPDYKQDDWQKSLKDTGTAESVAFMDTITKGLNKKTKKLGYDEISKLTPEYLAKALSMPKSWKKKYLDPKFDTQKEIDAEIKRRGKDKKKKEQEEKDRAIVSSFDQSFDIHAFSGRFRAKNLHKMDGTKISGNDYKHIKELQKQIAQSLKKPWLLEPAAAARAKEISKQLDRISGQYRTQSKKTKSAAIQKKIDAILAKTKKTDMFGNPIKLTKDDRIAIATLRDELSRL